MKKQKQLLPLRSKPLIRHCLDTLLSAELAQVIVVLGAGSADIEGVIEGSGVEVAFNLDSRSEMRDSVDAGLRLVNRGVEGILVCLADHPLVQRDTVMRLVDHHRRKPQKVLIPVYKGRRGHPTLFPTSLLHSLGSGENLRSLLRRHDDLIIHLNVDDEGVVLDIDTQDDYKSILSREAP